MNTRNEGQSSAIRWNCHCCHETITDKQPGLLTYAACCPDLVEVEHPDGSTHHYVALPGQTRWVHRGECLEAFRSMCDFVGVTCRTVPAPDECSDAHQDPAHGSGEEFVESDWSFEEPDVEPVRVSHSANPSILSRPCPKAA
jgi:hypothetical protein